MMRKRSRVAPNSSDSLSELRAVSNQTDSFAKGFFGNIINPVARDAQTRSMMRKRGGNQTATSSLAEAEVVEQTNVTSSANSSFAQRLKNNIVNHIVNPASREDKTMMRKRSGTTDIVPTSLAQKEYDDQEAVGDSAVSRLKPDVQAIEGVSADAEVSVQETATRSEVPT